MIRKSSGFKQILGAALVAAAAMAAPAHAEVIGFEGGFGGVGGTEVYTEGNYNVGFYANVAGDGEGTLVGQFINSVDSDCDSSMACPVGHAGTYYGALNDGYIDIMSGTIGAFSVKSFDASFIGGSPVLGSYTAFPGFLRLLGIQADGTSMFEDFDFTGPTADGFTFSHFETSDAFASTAFNEVIAFGFSCDATGCTDAFTNNRGQFGIDNIDMVEVGAAGEVPEPATLAMLGLGLAGLAGARRRSRRSGKQS